MPTDHSGDRFGEPWSDATYRGFAGQPGPGRRRGRFGLPRISQRQLAIGAGGAVALGLLLGLWARPNLGASHDTDAAERAAPAVPIEVNRPPPPQPLVSNGKLEVLPPDLSAANRTAGPSAAPPVLPSGAAAAASLAPPPPAPAPAPASAGPTVVRGNPPPLAVQTPPAAPRADGAACTGGGAADQMVCGDPELAGADREMRRAYRRALAAGAAPAALRADQRDWLAIREEAARHSRQALAQVYDQRIEELNAAAADRDGAQDNPDF